MNQQTVDLIERPYQEIIDDILTAVIGGVVNEPIIFDLKVLHYPLAEPAQDVRNITGRAKGERSYAFQKGIDFTFSALSNIITWLEGGTSPDDGTTFYVDYLRKHSLSPLTDVNVGSVSRTLCEAIGREIATVYQQINLAYLSAFIDTAEGKSLDMVVAILGIQRLTKEYAVGQVTFFRDTAVEGNITLQDGTLLRTKDGKIFQTTQLCTLQRGQIRINVAIRSTDKFKGDEGRVGSSSITELAVPIAGISRVNNFDATFLGASDETDDELRTRSKTAIRAAGRGTLAALAQAVFEERAALTDAKDPNGPPDKRSDPGTVVLMVESEPERFSGLKARIEETRAAGVYASVIAHYIFFKPRVQAKITAGLPPAGKAKIIDDIIAAIQEYTDSLGSGDPAKGKDMLKAIGKVKDVSESKIKDVMTWRTDLGQASNEAAVDAIMKAIVSAPSSDPDALRRSITGALSSESASTSITDNRVIDRSLVQGPAGDRATDDQIMTGNFQIVATVKGEKWWMALDMEPADVLLTGA
jgi:hypothetical protein